MNMKNDVKHKHTFSLNTIRLDEAAVQLLEQKSCDSDYICKALAHYTSTQSQTTIYQH